MVLTCYPSRARLACMPIKLTLPHAVIESDDPEQIALLYQKLSGLVPATAGQPPTPKAKEEGRKAAKPAPSPALTWDDFLAMNGEVQRRILEALRQRHEMTVDEIRTTTGIDKNQRVTGFIAGIHKYIRKAGLLPEDVYTRENRMIHGTLTSVYVSGRRLKESGPIPQ